MTAMRKKLAVILSLFMVSAVVMAGCSESSSKTGTKELATLVREMQVKAVRKYN